MSGLSPRRIATLRAAIAEGRFREDLYYRLSMVELTVPALQDRPEDVALLARHFVHKFSREFSKPVEGLTPRASIVLERYGWPGNVRELEPVIARACMLTDGPVLDEEDLPEHFSHQATAALSDAQCRRSSAHPQLKDDGGKRQKPYTDAIHLLRLTHECVFGVLALDSELQGIPRLTFCWRSRRRIMTI